ncbi:calcium-binding protein, partial [Streptomyces sp. SID10362]|nr:calcium-binding protein [Streptomyces sp. SID10362]
MRIRATVAAVTGALALSAFAVPAVQADEKPDAGLSVPSGAEIFGD